MFVHIETKYACASTARRRSGMGLLRSSSLYARAGEVFGASRSGRFYITLISSFSLHTACTTVKTEKTCEKEGDMWRLNSPIFSQAQNSEREGNENNKAEGLTPAHPFPMSTTIRLIPSWGCVSVSLYSFKQRACCCYLCTTSVIILLLARNKK